MSTVSLDQCPDYTSKVSDLIDLVLGPMVLMVKNPLANAGDVKDLVQSLGGEDPLEESMAAHSSILAWRIPWTETSGVQSVGSQRVGYD